MFQRWHLSTTFLLKAFRIVIFCLTAYLFYVCGHRSESYSKYLRKSSRCYVSWVTVLEEAFVLWEVFFHLHSSCYGNNFPLKKKAIVQYSYWSNGVKKHQRKSKQIISRRKCCVLNSRTALLYNKAQAKKEKCQQWI